jgi:hypothetical protein
MAGGAHTTISEERIREELSRVLNGHEFRTSKRSQDFLRYVVEHALHGQVEMLKERIIGMEVFGRPASYDPGEDATVRVKAGEVRKRLGLYYSGEGAHDPIRIELPSGAYVPEFHAAAPSTGVEAPAAPEPRRRIPWRAVAVMTSAALLGAAGLLNVPGPSILDQFWAPVLNGKAPVLICAAFVPVWNLDRAPNASGPPRAEDYVPLPDQFVGGGDLLATSRLTAMLTRMHHTYRLKVGDEAGFADLRNGPAILVGYSITRWRAISAQLRYFIDGNRRPVGITDNGKPTPWALPNLPPDRHTSEDYAIVTRMFHPDMHAMLVEIAGILQYGTDAAGDLVTNPDLLAEALRDAPPGWRTKNLQMIVHVKVIAGVPTSPKVIKTYFW